MDKEKARKRRAVKTKAIIRKSNRPRLSVHRSATHIYAQIIVEGDKGDVVLVSASTVDKELKKSLAGNKCDAAALVGRLLAERAKSKDLSDVAFDRAGYRYHGRVAALAKGAREAGLNF